MPVTRTSSGTMISGAAGVTALFGAGAAAGDTAILIVETANQPLPGFPSGFGLLGAMNGEGVGTAGAASATAISGFIKQSITAGDISGGVAVGDSGDHQNAWLATFSGLDPTTPYVRTQDGLGSPATTSVSIASANNSTVITPNDLALAIIVTDRDSNVASTNASAAWANITGSNSFIENESSATGQGGGIIVNQLTPSANQTAPVTFSCTITSSIWVGRVFVLKAPASIVPARALDPMQHLLIR